MVFAYRAGIDPSNIGASKLVMPHLKTTSEARLARGALIEARLTTENNFSLY